MPGTQVIVAVKHIRLDKKGPMISAYTICTAMFGNGAGTGLTAATTAKAVQQTQKTHKVLASAFSAAAAGPTMRTTAGQRLASGSIPAAGTTTSGFGLCSLLRPRTFSNALFF